MKFHVVPPRRRLPTLKEPGFILQQDNWNDFSFRTQYQLYWHSGTKKEDPNDLIGSVKILKRKQSADGVLQITADFELLDDQHCSVGESLDYYERLNALGPALRDLVLVALRDVVRSPDLQAEFEQEEGWAVSLFRDHRDQGREFRTLAASLVTGDYSALPSDDLTFSFRIPQWDTPVEFSFRAPLVSHDYFSPRPILPGRIAVLVGRNGSGKSTLLARLARVAYGTATERKASPLADVGSIVPSGIGFPKIVNVAFSPFDSFRLPGSDGRNQRQLLKELERSEGRFAFIGLRDIVAEFSTEPSHQAEDIDPLTERQTDRLRETKFKSLARLVNEFEVFLRKVRAKDRDQLLRRIVRPLGLGLDDAFEDYFDRTDGEASLNATFLNLSTGHKIVLLITAGLVATVEPKSLVLVDEPETHLHPPLLAALMHALRDILDSQKAFGIVATHSPVVVQESLAQHVSIVSREGSLTKIEQVKIETFGESIGTLTAEIFGLQSDATDFHKVLDKLVDELKSLEKIEALFLQQAMSQQARAYVMARLSKSTAQ